MKLFLLATLAAGLPHTMAQDCRIPGLSCCGSYSDTSSPTLAEFHARLCYDYQCPEGYTGNDPCDCREMDTPSDGECCSQHCSTAGVTCPQGETLKDAQCTHGEDCAAMCCAVMCDSFADEPCPDDQIRLPLTRECSDTDGCDASHCCEPHCSTFSTCPADTEPNAHEECMEGDGSQGCSESKCCISTCASTEAATCGAGQRFKDTQTCDRESDCAEDSEDSVCCDSTECCEDIPNPEDRCGAPDPDEDPATYAARFCWGVGGFDGSSCPAGFQSRGEEDCHKSNGGSATASDCCEGVCGDLQGLSCPAGETFKPHGQIWGDESSFADSCCATMCSDSFDGTCPEGLDVRPETTCETDVCSESECCSAICSVWTGSCPTGFTKRSDDDSHMCTEGSCDAADCCKNYCGSMCSSGSSGLDCSSGNSFTSAANQDLNEYDQTGCASTDTDGNGELGDACTTDTCCAVRCSSWAGTCSGGLVKTDEWSRSCNGDEANCAASCCEEPDCNAWLDMSGSSCPDGTEDHRVGHVSCDGTDSDCHARCCKISCSAHADSVYTCPQGWEDYGADDDADWAKTTAAEAASYCCHKTCSSVPDGETCEPGSTMRPSSDGHSCLNYEDGTSDDAVCTASIQGGSCCITNCAAQFTESCPTGTIPRNDMHNCLSDDAGCTAEVCCYMTCAGAHGGAGVTCPTGSILADNGGDTCEEDCDSDTSGIQDDCHDFCSEERCCESDCTMAGVTCPGGKILNDDTCRPDCDSDSGIQDDCHDFCGVDRCCEDIHVPAGEMLVAHCEGDGDCASALTDTGYQVTIDWYNDAACTQSKGSWGDAGVSGTSATCEPATYGSGGEHETAVGFFLYCTAQGGGIYEFVASAAQCPPGEGSGDISLVETVGECVCDDEEDGVCQEWVLMTCTSGAAPPPPPPPPPCVTITADEVGAITDVIGTWTPTGGDSESILVDSVTSETGEFCPAVGTAAPFYHMPSLEDIAEMSVTEAPAPTPVVITPQALDADALATAAADVAAALVAPAPAPDAAPPPPPRQIKSSIVFPVAAEDVTTILEADSPERADFETGFKSGMAASLGGGGAVSPDDIVIVAITSGSLNVDFHIEVPAGVTQAAANMVATLDASTVAVTVGGDAITATEIATPTVAEVPPQDCSGIFSQCTSECVKTYKVTVVHSGIGERCAAQSCADPADCIDDEEVTCDNGEGDCDRPAIENKTAGGMRAATGTMAAMAVLFAVW